MSITGLSGISFAGQALQNVGSKSDPVGAAGQQGAPAQDIVADAGAAALSNILREMRADPRIAAQIIPQGIRSFPQGSEPLPGNCGCYPKKDPCSPDATFKKGTAGDDVIIGAPCDDFIQGLDGDDVLLGRNGDDMLVGGNGNDTLIGGNGDDVLVAGYGDDVLMGGPGKDMFVINGSLVSYIFPDTTTIADFNPKDDTIAFGSDFGLKGYDDVMRHARQEGNDVVITNDKGEKVVLKNTKLEDLKPENFKFPDQIILGIPGTCGPPTLTNGTAGDDLIIGSPCNDFIQGLDGDDTIYGGAGNDTIYGQEGNNSLIGGAGDDKIIAGPDNDTIEGGTGNDTIYGAGGNDVLTGGAGSDTFLFASNQPGESVITDFTATGPEADKIEFDSNYGIENFEDLKQNHAEQVGEDVVITNEKGDKIVLKNTKLEDLKPENFVFK